jgi:hypothetical protein
MYFLYCFPKYFKSDFLIFLSVLFYKNADIDPDTFNMVDNLHIVTFRRQKGICTVTFQRYTAGAGSHYTINIALSFSSALENLGPDYNGLLQLDERFTQPYEPGQYPLHELIVRVVFSVTYSVMHHPYLAL